MTTNSPHQQLLPDYVRVAQQHRPQQHHPQPQEWSLLILVQHAIADHIFHGNIAVASLITIFVQQDFTVLGIRDELHFHSDRTHEKNLRVVAIDRKRRHKSFVINHVTNHLPLAFVGRASAGGDGCATERHDSLPSGKYDSKAAVYHHILKKVCICASDHGWVPIVMHVCVSPVRRFITERTRWYRK